VDDLPLLDEATFLTGGRARRYGHVVVDEAQDLTPMQFRMVARRAPSGSITVLGDLAQATGPWTYRDWSEIRAHLPTAAPFHHDELTLGYRAPGRVLNFASRLLPAAAPGVLPTSSIRPGRTDPVLHAVPGAALVGAGLAEARRLAGEHALVALITPEQLAPQFARGAGRDRQVGLLERDAMTRPVTIVPAPSAKGLEFDAVVVAEPSLVAGEDERGLRLLYVAMTRPIQHLSVVHSSPLPAALVD
jgi:DNA helicase IV